MKLKTIEIFQIDNKKNKRLIKKIASFLPTKAYFHFLYEPQLIIRVEKESVASITTYLSKRNLEYSVYNYPFPSKKGRFGEDKTSVMIKYQQYFRSIMHLNSHLAIEREKQDDFYIIERALHTMLNTMGYQWKYEVIFLLKLAWGRVMVIKKYECRILGEKIYCWLASSMIDICIRMTKFLPSYIN